MCPACISIATLMIVGSISTGGLAMLIRLKFSRPKPAARPRNDESITSRTNETKRKRNKMDPEKLCRKLNGLPGAQAALAEGQKNSQRLRD